MQIQRKDKGVLEGDLTPMIDMTFQLIAFFMVLINFNQNEQHEQIQLPDSVLAKPAESALEYPITLHLTKDGAVILGGQQMGIESLAPYLLREKQALENEGKLASDATVIIRAHKDAQTGAVQDLIKKCQDSSFEKFALRVKEDVGNK